LLAAKFSLDPLALFCPFSRLGLLFWYLLLWNIAKCLATLTAATDKIPFKVKIGISANKRFISVWCLHMEIKLYSYYLSSCPYFAAELQLQLSSVAVRWFTWYDIIWLCNCRQIWKEWLALCGPLYESSAVSWLFSGLDLAAWKILDLASLISRIAWSNTTNIDWKFINGSRYPFPSFDHVHSCFLNGVVQVVMVAEYILKVCLWWNELLIFKVVCYAITSLSQKCSISYAQLKSTSKHSTTG